ncbi:hypothetical protein [Streptomyces poonensis]|uniref:Secreted protein n=1 Tax=Streptomyces poonensis TaxID=68255 RepID=A0A918PVS5_9ACTN|nr:hypothetical protein [Streptomyces poonensis]GGZ24644.1 hypothetical protein GCM10010365_51220 [Streptomyces poonensis]GLJ90008.1 hypothetical protein GCM10017589_26090 [Streptomyces poonensis]
MPRLRTSAAAVLAAVALAAASPAAQALSKYSPDHEAYAWTQQSDKFVSVKTYTSNSAHADYYRAASNTTQRHLWNKSGAGTTATSGGGSKIFKLRTCEWVKDNDDDCSGWDY